MAEEDHRFIRRAHIRPFAVYSATLVRPIWTLARGPGADASERSARAGPDRSAPGIPRCPNRVWGSVSQCGKERLRSVWVWQWAVISFFILWEVRAPILGAAGVVAADPYG